MGPISRCYYNFRPAQAPLHKQLDSGNNLSAPFINTDAERVIKKQFLFIYKINNY